MTGPHTITDPQEYWDRYYAEQFRFGLGTEDILAALMQVPPVSTWVDLGCGSESMLWAIGLRAQQLVAVDADPRRLAILRKFTSVARPRGVHRTALALCGRGDPEDFPARCRSLAAMVAVDCLTGHPPSDPSLPTAGFELVTQFGLLGLCRDIQHFASSFTAAHQPLEPGGWAAGANWVARNPDQRVELTEQVYRVAAAHVGIDLLLIHRVRITADPDFTAVWTYVGRKHHHGHRRSHAIDGGPCCATTAG
ncbi:MAG: class I SAM-dependent methyltransferase [Pseudonocardiaceae bacterium]